MPNFNKSRREFVQKVAYVAPMIATISVIPSIASAGSVRHANNGVGNGPDCLPPGLEKNGKSFLDNDDQGGTPGNPQNQGGPNGFAKKRH
jgi:hypothetical protein